MTVVQKDADDVPGPVVPPQEPLPRPPSGTRRLAVALVCCGMALTLWIVGLAKFLPVTVEVSHWSAMWVGLDVLEALGLGTTGVLLLRKDPRCCLTAAAAGALLVVDAWFDVLTSEPGSELATALAMAVGIELPLAALCAVVAVRSMSRCTPARYERDARPA